MATRAEIYQAIRNADAAGDSDSVQKLGAYLKTMPADGVTTPQTTAPTQPKKGTGSDALDAANAVSSGFNRAGLTLLGVPVDTVVNLSDLGKAGLGYVSSKFNGGKIPEVFQVNPDRSQIVGSGDWLKAQARKSELGSAIIDPANPDYEGGYLQAGGAGLTAVMNPKNALEAVNQGVLGVTGSLAGKAVYDKTGSNALAIAASMSPTLAQNAATGASKLLVRGGEQGRQAMAQRAQDLKNAGVEQPTLGLASGNQFVGGVENLLQNTPGAVKVMRASRDRAVAGLQDKVMQAADAAAPVRGSLEAGQAIQSGIGDFRGQFKARQGQLYDQLDNFIPPGTPANVTSTQNALAALNADIPGAPELSKLFKNGRIQGIESALNSDLQRPVAYSPSQLREALASNPETLGQLDAALGKGTLPFEAVKKTRTLVGNEIADTNLASTVPRSKWNPLYGALSDDMQAAANKAGPDATNALDRANRFSRAGMERIDRIQPFVSPDAPEQSFQLLNRTLGDNASTLQAVKKSLPDGARGTIAGTVIERLGKATPGQQNASGEAWSPETFLTNWNKMSPKARQELFSGFENAEQVAADVNSVAQATSMMRENSKMWANPSGTAANVGARAALGAVGGGLFFNPQLAAAGAAGIGSANALARALTSKWATESALRKNNLSPALQAAAIRNALASSEQGQ